MRPSDSPYGRNRSSSANADDSIYSFHPPSSGPHMTYAIGDEAAVDAALEQSLATLHRSQRESHKRRHSGTDKSDAAPSSSAGSPPRSRPFPRLHDDARSIPDSENSRPVTPSAYKPFGTPSTHAMASPSQPLTPLLGASGPASALSSTSSRRNSLVGSLSEDMGSAHMGSVAGDDTTMQESSMLDSGSAPQLVMPSIKMPSRRPFTETGKNMGRLKVMIAGAAGVGKTSLVKAIVQSCEHIVHVDPIAQPSLTLGSRGTLKQSSRNIKRAKAESATSQIAEIYASTKPYPEWWTDLEDVKILRRRKSLGDTVLDRNLCFVDTPGFADGPSPMETIDPIVQYVESHLRSLAANSLHDSDLLSLVSGDGGPQVDVVFYIISGNLKPGDIQFLGMLSPLTNIIPLVAQGDSMSPEQVAAKKEDIADQLRDAEIRPFTFGGSSLPYAISSAPGSDHETMDASLLMSPDYVQPLIPSDLAELVSQVFCQDGASWLRHSAARKFVQWRISENASRPQALYRPLSFPSATRPLDAGGIRTPPLGPASTFALARMTDHTQREERLAQIRLANWAAELQRSLANERARYETVARSERAVWLTERLSECVQDGSLVPISGEARRGSDSSSSRELVRHKIGGRRLSSSKALQKHQDPLGLLEVTANLRASSWVALEVIGSLGVIGGLAFWLSRQYWSLPTSDTLASEWTRFWYGDR